MPTYIVPPGRGTFSEAMDTATLNATTVTLKNAAGAAVTAGVSYDAAAGSSP